MNTNIFKAAQIFAFNAIAIIVRILGWIDIKNISLDCPSGNFQENMHNCLKVYLYMEKLTFSIHNYCHICVYFNVYRCILYIQWPQSRAAIMCIPKSMCTEIGISVLIRHSDIAEPVLLKYICRKKNSIGSLFILFRTNNKFTSFGISELVDSKGKPLPSNVIRTARKQGEKVQT